MALLPRLQKAASTNARGSQERSGRRPRRAGAWFEWLEDRVTPSVANVYVNAAWAGTTLGADPDGAGPATAFGTDAFATIQTGINGVSAGGVVDVAAGTYNEAPTINKSLTLQGNASGNRPLIELASGTSAYVQITASNVTIKHIAVNKNDTASDVGLFNIPRGGTFPNYTIAYSNITLDDIAGTGGRRAAYFTVQNMTITNSSFSGQTRDSIYFDAVAGVTNITDNQFSGSAGSKKAVLIEGFTGIPASSGTVNITGNTVTGKDNFFVYNSWGAPGTPISLNVSNNTIVSTNSNAVAIYDPRIDVPSFDPSVFVKIASATVSGNDFSGVASGKMAVIGIADLNYPVNVNASGNWFGTADPATALAKTSGPVDITPLLASGTDTDGVAPGFQGDFSSLIVHTLGTQTAPNGRVQEGINLVETGGTVSVLTGTYSGDVILAVDATVSLANSAVLNGKTSGSSGTIDLLGAASLGDGSATGVSFGGTINVGGNALTLLDSDGADLDGDVTLAGGAITAAGGLRIGGTLSGYGTVVGAMTVKNGGTVDPGFSLASGAATFLGGSTLSIDLNGLVAGVDYGQLSTNGLTVNGAMLDLALGFTPTVGQTFVLVDNPGVAPVAGTLFGGVNGVVGALAEGAVFKVSGQKFVLSYVGGDGNDVVLTVPPPNATIDFNLPGLTPGQTAYATVAWRNQTGARSVPQTIKIYRSSDGTLAHRDALLASAILNPIPDGLASVMQLSWIASVADSNAPDSLGVVTPDGTAASYLLVVVDEEDLQGDGTLADDWMATSMPAYVVTVPDITFLPASSDLVATEGVANSGRLALRRSGDTSQPLTVYVDWNNGTPSASPTNEADFGGKYPGSAGVGQPTAVTFAAGVATASIRVSPVTDSNSAPSEKLSETLTATLIGVPGLLGDAPYTIDRDSTGAGESVMAVQDVVNTISIRTLDGIATEKRNTTAKFRLSRGSGQSAKFDATVTVDFGGTATPGAAGDYTAYIGTTPVTFYSNGGPVTLADITIPARRNYVDITIRPNDDNAIETDETIVPAVQSDPTNNQRYIPASPTTASAVLGDNDDIRLAATVTGTPLMIASPTSSSAKRLRFTVTVTNFGANGNSAATVLQVGLLRVDAGGPDASTYDQYLIPLQGVSVPAVRAGAKVAKSFSIRVALPGDLTPGSYRVAALADAGHAVAETNEFDNYGFSGALLIVS